MVFPAEAYIHDMDRRAFAALNKFPHFVKLCETYMANYDEKAARIELLSDAIRLSENQMPEVYNLLPSICEKLGIGVPEIYYVPDKVPNAGTYGATNPCIYVTSGLIKTLPLDLIASILAHECGHIACRHSLYHTMVTNVIDKVEESPLGGMALFRKHLSPGLRNAFLFWDRCSELSADRAAALCDGDSKKTVDALIQIHGYKNVNLSEFVKQAFDLKSMLDESKGNKILEQMLVATDSHPRLATRVYECMDWANSATYRSLLDGTYMASLAAPSSGAQNARKETKTGRKSSEADGRIIEEEIVAAEVQLTPVTRDATSSSEAPSGNSSGAEPGNLSGTSFSASSENLSGASCGHSSEAPSGPVPYAVLNALANTADTPTDAQIEEALARVNSDLARYTSHAGKAEYAMAVFSGVYAGVLDSLCVGEISFDGTEMGLSHRQVNNFIQGYAKARGLGGDRLKDCIRDLEDEFKVLQDNIWKGENIGVSAKNHHLADLAHHPTPLGLMSAIVVQFLRVGTFVNRDGEWKFVFVKTGIKDLVDVLTPVIITGVLNWLVYISEKRVEEANGEADGEPVPESLSRLMHLVASTPMLVEVAKCADNWFGHLVSDMGGSKNTAGGGMGIPGVFLSLMYELSSLPGLKDSGLPAFLNNLYVNGNLDLRHEMCLYRAAGKQAVPVIFNEIYVRVLYFAGALGAELGSKKNLRDIDWSLVVPFRNRTVDRMLMVASMTFTVADTADAAVRSAILAHGDWITFSQQFVARFNYVGAGRAAIAIVREVSNERKEEQLLREKLILTEAKTARAVERFEAYRKELEQRLAEFLAEDLESFLHAFGDIRQGMDTGDSELVIQGNVTIQRVLGKTPQFTSQKEFDALMDSDDALVL